VSLLPSLDIGLAFLVVTVACSTIITRDLFAAVISYVAYGLLLAFHNGAVVTGLRRAEWCEGRSRRG
jgi:hypothetical protein